MGGLAEADALPSHPCPSWWVPTLSLPPHQQNDSLKSSGRVGRWGGELSQESPMRKAVSLGKGGPCGIPTGFGVKKCRRYMMSAFDAALLGPPQSDKRPHRSQSGCELTASKACLKAPVRRHWRLSVPRPRPTLLPTSQGRNHARHSHVCPARGLPRKVAIGAGSATVKKIPMALSPWQVGGHCL